MATAAHRLAGCRIAGLKARRYEVATAAHRLAGCRIAGLKARRYEVATAAHRWQAFGSRA